MQGSLNTKMMILLLLMIRVDSDSIIINDGVIIEDFKTRVRLKIL